MVSVGNKMKLNHFKEPFQNTIFNGCLLLGWNIVISMKYQLSVLELLHEVCLGMTNEIIGSTSYTYGGQLLILKLVHIYGADTKEGAITCKRFSKQTMAMLTMSVPSEVKCGCFLP